MLQEAFVALVVFGAALEAALIFGKDYLLGTRKQAQLDAQIQQTQQDLRNSKQKIEERRAALMAAADEANRRRAQLQEADKAFQESQKVVPALVHVVGLPHSGACFRAAVSKDLPAKPDRSQKMIWSCKNFIEVWADDMAAAKTAIAKQFPGVQGYKVGEATPVAASAPPVAGAAA